MNAPSSSPSSSARPATGSPSPVPAVEQGPRWPDRWLAALRIVVGLWFLKSVATKLGVALAFGFLPVPAATARWVGFMPRRVAEYAQTVEWGAYREFLLGVVVPNGPVFANLTAFGEAAVGLGLTLGLLTRPAAAVGLLLMANYLTATFWVGPCQQGFHILLVACMAAFLHAGAGRTWGLDGWLAQRSPDAWWVRRGVV